MTLDKATGLLLRDKGSGGSLVATSVVVGVVTDATTFSTGAAGKPIQPEPQTVHDNGQPAARRWRDPAAGRPAEGAAAGRHR